MANTIGSDPKSLAGRPTEESELLGQVFTPQQIAMDMVEELFRDRADSPLTILDPAVGPGTFPVSMVASNKLVFGDQLVLRDIDEQMVARTLQETANVNNSIDIKRCDYLEESGGEYDLVVMNPPYVRQEWIDKKDHYRTRFKEHFGVKVPGTSNLYVYFVIKALAELKPGGKMVCIVYDSWLFTKFGRWLAGIMQANCSALCTTRVGQQPFQGRLIDATIISATRGQGEFEGSADESLAAEMLEKSPLAGVIGTAPISVLFHTKRGLRLKQADFFMIDLQDGRHVGATPFVKKPGRLKGYYNVPGNHPEAALLQYASDARNPLLEAEIHRRLKLAKKTPGKNVSVLTWHSERPDSWYLHRPAPYAPILFNYYIRHHPRHIFNKERVYADNFYGLTPLHEIDPLVPLAILNSSSVCVDILHRARNQGNGLKKIQLYEYRQALSPDWRAMSKSTQKRLRILGEELVSASKSACRTLGQIDDVIADELGAEEVSTHVLAERLNEHNAQTAKMRTR